MKLDRHLLRSVAILLLTGCGLASDPAKNACRMQDDCVAGYVCTGGRCELPTDGSVSPGQDGGDSPDSSVAPTCTDGAKNGSETGTDCGGGCGPCGDGTACNGNPDCAATSTCASSLLTTGTVCLPGRWHTKTPIPTKRVSAPAVANGDGRIYLFGGTSSPSDEQAVYVYDPSMDTWSTAAPMMFPSDNAAAALGSDGRIYVTAGKFVDFDNDQTARVQSYDPVANSWRLEPSLHTGRTAGALVATGTRLFEVGGEDFSNLKDVSTLESLAPGDTQWTADTFPMNAPRSGLAATLLADGRIFVVGGYAENVGDLASAETYDPAHPGWTTAPSMNVPRTSLGAAVLSGRVYVVGGNCYAVSCPGKVAPDTEVYDVAGKSWGLAAPMPTPRSDFGYAVVNGVLYTFGGDGPDDFDDADVVEAFTP